MAPPLVIALDRSIRSIFYIPQADEPGGCSDQQTAFLVDWFDELKAMAKAGLDKLDALVKTPWEPVLSSEVTFFGEV